MAEQVTVAQSPKFFGILSAIVTVALVIAWAITTGVISGSRSAAKTRQKERDDLLEPIVGKKEFTKIKINDAVKAGKIDKTTADALKTAVDAPKMSSVKTGGSVGTMKVMPVRPTVKL